MWKGKDYFHKDSLISIWVVQLNRFYNSQKFDQYWKCHGKKNGLPIASFPSTNMDRISTRISKIDCLEIGTYFKIVVKIVLALWAVPESHLLFAFRICNDRHNIFLQKLINLFQLIINISLHFSNAKFENNFPCCVKKEFFVTNLSKILIFFFERKIYVNQVLIILFNCE